MRAVAAAALLLALQLLSRAERAQAQAVAFSPAPQVQIVAGSDAAGLPTDVDGPGTASKLSNVYDLRYCWRDRAFYFVHHHTGKLRKLTAIPPYNIATVVDDLQPGYSADSPNGIALDQLCNAYISMVTAKIIRVPYGSKTGWVFASLPSSTLAIVSDDSRGLLWVLLYDSLYKISTSTAQTTLALSVSAGRYSSAGLALDTLRDRLLITENAEHTIRYIDLKAATLAESAPICGTPNTAGYTDGLCSLALLYQPRWSAWVPDTGRGDFLAWVEYQRHRLRIVNLNTFNVSTVASDAACYQDFSGAGTSACFIFPISVGYDPRRGDLYVATESKIVRVATGTALRGSLPAVRASGYGADISVTNGAGITIGA